MSGPKKYVMVDGKMGLNPEYKKWMNAKNANTAGKPAEPVSSVLHSSTALPIVSTMEDYEKLNDDLDGDFSLSESTCATIEMLQEEDVAAESGCSPEDMIDELGKMLAKFEIPIGLTNKLMPLSEFDSLEFIIDDSGSMSLESDTIDPHYKLSGKLSTRWVEANTRLKEMIEVLSYIPFNQIVIVFLNRSDQIILKREGRTPDDFLAHAYPQIDRSFSSPPAGTTPAYEKLRESFVRGQEASISRYFFGDGKPNGGQAAIDAIVKMLVNRPNAEENPLTFISCTNDDAATAWMKDAEEIAPYCSESDDFQDEAEEVAKDQGKALPYSKGFHLVCQLVAAMNPEDLDAMDECIPFTKSGLDNVMGVVSNFESYRHYFTCFEEAQSQRVIESPQDAIRKNIKWNYNLFQISQTRSKIPQVAKLLKQLKKAGGH